MIPKNFRAIFKKATKKLMVLRNFHLTESFQTQIRTGCFALSTLRGLKKHLKRALLFVVVPLQFIHLLWHKKKNFKIFVLSNCFGMSHGMNQILRMFETLSTFHLIQFYGNNRKWGTKCVFEVMLVLISAADKNLMQIKSFRLVARKLTGFLSEMQLKLPFVWIFMKRIAR